MSSPDKCPLCKSVTKVCTVKLDPNATRKPRVWVECSKCGLAGPFQPTPELAVLHWNQLGHAATAGDLLRDLFLATKGRDQVDPELLYLVGRYLMVRGLLSALEVPYGADPVEPLSAD